MRYIKLFENVKERMIIALDPDDFYADEPIKVVTEDTLPKNRRKDYEDMKFHIGDIVYYEHEESKYVIDAVELPYYGALNYHLDSDNNCFWTSEKPLKHEYERDAEKYNI